MTQPNKSQGTTGWAILSQRMSKCLKLSTFTCAVTLLTVSDPCYESDQYHPRKTRPGHTFKQSSRKLSACQKLHDNPTLRRIVAYALAGAHHARSCDHRYCTEWSLLWHSIWSLIRLQYSDHQLLQMRIPGTQECTAVYSRWADKHVRSADSAMSA